MTDCTQQQGLWIYLSETKKKKFGFIPECLEKKKIGGCLSPSRLVYPVTAFHELGRLSISAVT